MKSVSKETLLLVSEELEASIRVKADFLKDVSRLETLGRIIALTVECYRSKGKTLFIGNGGSAADAQHLAAEFVGRYKLERRALPSIALTTDTSLLTAVANDYGYDQVFSRQVEALSTKGDVLFALSTSGNSKSVLLAAEKARNLGLTVVGFTGESGGKLLELCHECIRVPSSDVARIQETHIALGHILCTAVEKSIFLQKY